MHSWLINSISFYTGIQEEPFIGRVKEMRLPFGNFSLFLYGYLDYITVSGTLVIAPDECEGIINACSAPYNVAGMFYNATFTKSRFFADRPDLTIDIDNDTCVILQVIRTVEKTCMVILSERKLKNVSASIVYLYRNPQYRFPCYSQTVHFFLMSEIYEQETFSPHLQNFQLSRRLSRLRYLQRVSDNSHHNTRCRYHTYTYLIRVVLHQIAHCSAYHMYREAAGATIADHNACGLIMIKEIKKYSSYRFWIIEDFKSYLIVNANQSDTQISNIMYIQVGHNSAKAAKFMPLCNQLKSYHSLTITNLKNFRDPSSVVHKTAYGWRFERLVHHVGVYIRQYTPVQLEYRSVNDITCAKGLQIRYGKAVLSFLMPEVNAECGNHMLKVTDL